MNEAETRAVLIDPALREAGRGVAADSRVRRETICPGRIEGAGRHGKPEIADYVLTFRNHKPAVIEAKAETKDRPDRAADNDRPPAFGRRCRSASMASPPSARACNWDV